MREILFRGKSKDGLRWVYGSLYKEGSQVFILIGGRFYPEPSNGKSTFGIVDWYEVFPDSIGQFTGLVDKNGKRIFEGDILRDNKGEDGIVAYIESVACFMAVHDGKEAWDLNEGDPKRSTQLQYTKVIGNIRDNPELLKE